MDTDFCSIEINTEEHQDIEALDAFAKQHLDAVSLSLYQELSLIDNTFEQRCFALGTAALNHKMIEYIRTGMSLSQHK